MDNYEDISGSNSDDTVLYDEDSYIKSENALEGKSTGAFFETINRMHRN